jgi:hypothetical protein
LCHLHLSCVYHKVIRERILGQSRADTVQIRGGYGFMIEYEVERALRHAIASTL